MVFDVVTILFPLPKFPKKCKAAINDLKTLEDMCKAAAEVVIPLVLTTGAVVESQQTNGAGFIASHVLT